LLELSCWLRDSSQNNELGGNKSRVRQNKEDCQDAVLVSNIFLHKYAIRIRPKPN
jgi:hypothetical protein